MKHSINVHMTTMLGIGVQHNPQTSLDILMAQNQDGMYVGYSALYLVTFFKYTTYYLAMFLDPPSITIVISNYSYITDPVRCGDHQVKLSCRECPQDNCNGEDCGLIQNNSSLSPICAKRGE